MNLEILLKSFSIIPPAIVAIGGLYILSRGKMGRFSTVSEHAAQSRPLYAILAFILLLGGAMYLSMFWFFLIPKYQVPQMIWPLVATLIGLFIIALVPAHPTKKLLARFHTIGGTVILIAMYVAVWMFILSGSVTNGWTLAALWTFIGFMTFASVVVYLFRSLRSEVLILEMACACLFWILTGLLAYL